MRVLVHDYAGHPFQMQLSRGLAARSHRVDHLYCGSTLTPRGELNRRPDDPPNLEIRAITLPQTIPKSNFLRRHQLESDYARRLAAECQRLRPDVVLSANTPSLSQLRLTRVCRRLGIRSVNWIQDIYGLAAYRVLRRKLPGIGQTVGRYFIEVDKKTARLSDAIVVISSDFTDVLRQWGVDVAKVHVIHNWAPLENLPIRPRDNDWAEEKQLGPGPRFVYSGTLSLKTNPALLLALARTMDERGAGELIVVSQGDGVEWLRAEAQRCGVKSLKCFGFQPFASMPDVLGSADVLIAILEKDAGVFCVPSKVLTYFCAQRPLLLAVPPENLAAKTVEQSGAGIVVAPDDLAGFCRAAFELADLPEKRDSCATAARRYAEQHFDFDQICDRFEAILTGNL